MRRAALEASRRWAADMRDATYTFTFNVQAVDSDGTLVAVSRTSTYDGDTAFREIYAFDHVKWLLSQGLVKVDFGALAHLPERQFRIYRAAEAIARDAKVGMWANPLREGGKPVEWRQRDVSQDEKPDRGPGRDIEVPVRDLRQHRAR